MTDKEIIKALECCGKNDCTDCPYRESNDGYSCITELMEDVFELHKSQQAEIQVLREDIHNRKARENKLRSKIKGFKTEIERLKKRHLLNLLEQLDIAEKIKTEAIKEFADKYVKELVDTYDLKGLQIDNINRVADNLVKEMVGEQG